MLVLVHVASAYDTDSPYGVTAFIPSPTRWDAMLDADIDWGRCDFSWRSVEASGKGIFDWGVTDDAVAQADARGLNIYAGLGYTPSWASTGGRSNDVPTDMQDWYDYVYACVSRYKDSVHFWEIWNEPNLTQFWAGGQDKYIELLKVGADAAHAADPDCMVLAPELSSAGPARSWMTNVLQQAGDKIDIISFHQYDGGDVPSGRLAGIDAMYRTIVAAGFENKPIWVTESGWESDSIGEQRQAQYLTEMLEGMQSRPWWQKFFWYQIWEGPTGRAGLLYQDETPKPSWYAYRDYTAAHPAPEAINVNLSTADIVDGLSLVTVGDGHTTPDTVASRSCRRNTDVAAGDYYMYFDVADDFAFAGDRPGVAIDVDYYDLGSATLTLQYDSNGDGVYKNGGSF
ncbi:MAG: hypothetical protein KDA63_17700, partial [Planctomycetales bacterium]|nr:hypothetical protein [Planctomycetales bacterium]